LSVLKHRTVGMHEFGIKKVVNNS